MANRHVLEKPHLCGLSDDSKKFPAYAAYQNVQHLRIQCADLFLVRYRQDQSAYGSGGQCDPALGLQTTALQKRPDMRLVIMIMRCFDLIWKPAEQELRVVFDEYQRLRFG